MSASGIAEVKRLWAQNPLKYFSSHELLTMGGSHYARRSKNSSVDFARAGDLYRIAVVANEVRQRFGFPMLIVSGFRSRKYNQFVGGAPRSYHLRGRALDFIPVHPGRLSHLKEVASAYQAEGEIGGLGFYKTFVHIDNGPRRNWGR